MEVDIVCNESELSMAINKMEDYGEFLNAIIAKYRTILSSVESEGINDEKIDTELLMLRALIGIYEVTIPAECRKVSSNVRKYMNDVSAADKFEFPESIMSIVATIVSPFK